MQSFGALAMLASAPLRAPAGQSCANTRVKRDDRLTRVDSTRLVRAIDEAWARLLERSKQV